MSERVVLVTGAAGGIGRAIVERLERDGWSVHGVDVDDADLTTRDGNRSVVDAALERFGRLDAVVANAGFQHVAPVRDFPEDEWERLQALLVTSPFLLAKYAWEALFDAYGVLRVSKGVGDVEKRAFTTLELYAEETGRELVRLLVDDEAREAHRARQRDYVERLARLDDGEAALRRIVGAKAAP